MNKRMIALCLGSLLALSSTWAGDTPGAGKERKFGKEPTPEQKERREAFKKEMVEKFDTNKNGVLDPDEKEKAKAAREKHKTEMQAKFDTNKDGKLDETERHAKHEAMKKACAAKKTNP